MIIVRSLNVQGHRGLNPFEFIHADLTHASVNFEGGLSITFCILPVFRHKVSVDRGV